VVTRNSILIAAVTTLSLTVIGAMLSDAFSPLSEILRDSVSSLPNAKIKYAKIFDNKNRTVTQIVTPGTKNVTSTSIIFWFYPGENEDTKRDRYFLFLNYPLFSPDTLYQFECSIDGQPFEQCLSPKAYANLSTETMHIFKVRTKGILGNTQDSPTPFNFTTVTASYVKALVKDYNTTPVKNGTVKLDEVGNQLVTLNGTGSIRYHKLVFIPSGGTIPFNGVGSNNENISSGGTFSFNGVGQGMHSLVMNIPRKDSTSLCSDTFFVAADTPFTKLDIFLNEINCQRFSLSDINNKSEILTQNIEPVTYNQSQINPRSLQPVTTNITSPLQTGSIEIAQESKRLPDNINLFKTRFWINATNSILSNITNVTYYLHPTFVPNEINSITPQNQFGITITNWGVFNLKARIFFNDGGVKDLELPIDKWNSPK
jgi:YEATS family